MWGLGGRRRPLFVGSLVLRSEKVVAIYDTESIIKKKGGEGYGRKGLYFYGT